jgi:hypothetical protein
LPVKSGGKFQDCFHSAYLLTPWSRVILEKLTGSAASQEIPRIFFFFFLITVLTSARLLFCYIMQMRVTCFRKRGNHLISRKVTFIQIMFTPPSE